MIIRDVPPTALSDLLSRPPRATLAAVVDDRIELLPIVFTLDDPAHPQSSWITVTVPPLSPNLARHEIVVIVDDGPQWFLLRSLTFRGTAIPAGDHSYRFVPTRVVAWDYGSLRHKPTPPEPIRQPAVLPTTNGDDPTCPYTSTDLAAALSASRVMILASCSPRGRPFAVPLWFVHHRGRLYATTSASSWTAHNISVCPEVAVLLGGEKGQGTQRLVIRAHVCAVSGTPMASVLARIAWRYYLSPRFAATELGHMRLWGRRLRYYMQSRPAYLIITPQSADNRQAPI